MLKPNPLSTPQQLFTHTIQSLIQTASGFNHILMWGMQPRAFTKNIYRSEHLHKPRLPCFFEQTLPSNSSHTIGSSEQNKCHPQILAMAIICRSACVGIFDDNHHATTRVIYVVQVISTTHSRTERLWYY